MGNLVAAFPAVTLGPFYYRDLETDKAKALQQFNGNYDDSVRLSNEAKKEVCWQITNIMCSLQHIHVPVSYVNNKGGIKSKFCDEIAKEPWV